MEIHWTNADLRDAVMHCHFNKVNPRSITEQFHRVPTRKIKDILMRIEQGINENIIYDSYKSQSIHRFVCSLCKIKIEDGYAYTDEEIRMCLLDFLSKKRTLRECHVRYGTNDTLIRRVMKQFFQHITYNNVKDVKKAYVSGEYTIIYLKETIAKLVFRKRGRPTILSADEEALLVCSADMRATIGLPNTRRMLGQTLEKVIEQIPKTHKRPLHDKSRARYARRVVQRVMRKELDMGGDSLYDKTNVNGMGEVKVSCLSNARARQSDPRLSAIMYYRILKMYEDGYETVKVATANILNTLQHSPVDTPQVSNEPTPNSAQVPSPHLDAVTPSAPSPPSTSQPASPDYPPPGMNSDQFLAAGGSDSPPDSPDTSPQQEAVTPTPPSPPPHIQPASPDYPPPGMNSDQFLAAGGSDSPPDSETVTPTPPSPLPHFEIPPTVDTPDSPTDTRDSSPHEQAVTPSLSSTPPSTAPPSPCYAPPGMTTEEFVAGVAPDSPPDIPDLEALNDGEEDEVSNRNPKYDDKEWLAKILPRPDQIWNADEVGFDPNGSWLKIVCTFLWCMKQKIWITQTGERAPFWVSFLFFTRADGQCFIPPTIVHKSCNLTGAHGLNIPGNWITHATPSGYMDRDGWLKTSYNFVKLCGASELDPQFLYIDGHDSHWDADALDYLRINYVFVFFLKAGDSENDQPNDNGSNCKLKGIFAGFKEEWKLKYATVPFTVPYFNELITKSWEKFKLTSSGCIIRSFEKTGLHPLRAPEETISDNLNKGCLSQMQMPTGKKASEIKTYIEEHTDSAPYSVNTNTHGHVEIKTAITHPHNRNLLIRTAVWDSLQTSTIIPVQQLQKELLLHVNSARNKVTKSSTLNRQNPDTKAGLYVNGTVQQEARNVQANKAQADKLATEAKRRNQQKKAEIYNRRKNVYLDFAPKMVEKGEDCFKQFTVAILNDVFAFLGGKQKELTNKNKSGIIEGIKQLVLFKELMSSRTVNVPALEEDEIEVEALMAPEGSSYGIDPLNLFAGNEQHPEGEHL